MAKEDVAVAIYNTHTEAEQAVKTLQKGGVDMQKLSIVGKDYHTEEHVVGYYNIGDRMKAWGRRGAFWGGIWGILFGTAFFMIPGIGPVVLAGPLVASLVAGLEGAAVVGGLSALGGALAGLGIPKNSVIQYETALKADKFLVLVHGTSDEVTRAKSIIDGTKPAEAAVHHA
jgi:uncharacterized membrane protein